VKGRAKEREREPVWLLGHRVAVDRVDKDQAKRVEVAEKAEMGEPGWGLERASINQTPKAVAVPDWVLRNLECGLALRAIALQPQRCVGHLPLPLKKQTAKLAEHPKAVHERLSKEPLRSRQADAQPDLGLDQ
jgi:hypothetical protein